MGRLASGGAVFAADPAFVAQLVQQAEEMGVVHFTGVGFVAIGHAGNLDVADATRGNEAAQQHGEIAPDDLQVVEVQLQLQCGVVFQQGLGRVQ